MADALTFEPVTHTYRLGDRVLPSVTQALSVLDQYEGVPQRVLEAAREFGQHVHMACDLDNKGVLDEATLDPALAPYLAGWRKYRADSGLVIVESELRLHDARLGYAGTCDVLGELRGQRCVIDIKSGLVPKTVGAQTAAYANALKVRRRYCVQLMPNDYRVHALTDPADFYLFLSCLNIAKWREKNL